MTAIWRFSESGLEGWHVLGTVVGDKFVLSGADLLRQLTADNRTWTSGSRPPGPSCASRTSASPASKRN
jgi:hypothetical protein